MPHPTPATLPLLLLPLLAATATATPRECALVSAGVRPRTAQSRGTWRVKAGQVGPSRRRMQPGLFWLAGGRGSGLAHGTVRARFTHGKRLNVTLLLRARLDSRSQRVEEGLALRMRGRYLWLSRIKGGVAKRVSFIGRRARVPRRQSLEVVVLMYGKHLLAHVYHHPTGKHLGVLSSGKATSQHSGLGLYLFDRRADPASPLTHLATREACEHTPASDAQNPTFTVAVPRDEAARMAPLAPHVKKLEQLDDAPVRDVYRADAAGLERMLCDGRNLLGLRTRLPWKYLDENYLALRDVAPQKTPTGFVIDRSLKNPRMVEALLRGWHKRYPKLTRLKKIGQSRQGRPIWALGIGAHAARPSFLLNGAHHGDEVLTVEFVLDAIQVLLESSATDPRVKRWLQELTVWCVPVINPDGLAGSMEVFRYTGRKNGAGQTGSHPQVTYKGVDLNRNYPFRWGATTRKASGSRPTHWHYRGPSPGSEPETRAMMRLARQERFAASISFHSGTIGILAPYTIDGVKNPEPNEAWTVARQVARKLGPHPQPLSAKSSRLWRFRVRRKLYSVDGTDQDWLRHSFGTLALLVEGAVKTPLKPAPRKKIVEAVRPTWQLLLDRYLDGPTLSGEVLGPGGRGVQAEVRIRETTTHEGERWTTRARDGRFDRFLHAAGSYHVRVSAPGYRSQTRVVKVSGKRVHLRITLKARNSK